MKELKIDPELRDLLPPLTDEEFRKLEKNIIENGFDRNFPIMEWNGFIADGHNRYTICKKHNITPVIGTLAYETKDEVMEWMLDIQLGRRNLSPIQRIAVTEKYRPIYEKQAQKNLEEGGRKGGMASPNKLPSILTEASTVKIRENETNNKLAKIAGVKPTLYKMGAKVLNSDNDDIKKRVLAGKTSISAGYKELTQNFDVPKENHKSEVENRESNGVTDSSSQESAVSEETKQICADLKIEKTKEYLESIWDYRIAIIESMNVGFNRFYDGFVSILNDMDGRVTEPELKECIKNAESNVEKLLTAIELAKKIKLKMEDK